MSGRAVFGLSVRWSLAAAPAGAAQELRDYVVGTSMARFSELPGLAQKTWRMREGEWFEGTYIWADAGARDAFAASFGATGANNPGSKIIGTGPVSIENFEVVAIAEGPEGFVPGAGPGTGS
jgi:hypothetical protein